MEEIYNKSDFLVTLFWISEINLLSLYQKQKIYETRDRSTI